VISLGFSFGVEYSEQDNLLHLHFSRITPASGENVSCIDILLYISWGTPVSEYGIGFGEFSFLHAELKDLDGLPVSDASLPVGSWYITTDAFETISVRVLETEG